jgi:hypothetical protein
VLVDRTGIIRAQFNGDDPIFGASSEQSLRTRLEELLKTGGKGAATSKSTAKNGKKKS